MHDEAYWERRTAQPATEFHSVTGDEWNATTRLFSLQLKAKAQPDDAANLGTTADQLRVAIQCVEDLGEAEWRVRRDRDRWKAKAEALESQQTHE